MTEHLECASIHLDIFGREEVGKDDVEHTDQTTEGEGMEKRFVTTKYKMTKTKTDTVLNIDTDVYETPGGLAPGDYQIQFTFQLDKKIPSTYSLT